MDANELVEAIQYYYKNNQDTVVAINEIIKEIKCNQRMFSIKIQIALDSFCDYKLCNKCGNDLKTKLHSEKREYQGTMVNELITNYYCKNCDILVGD